MSSASFLCQHSDHPNPAPCCCVAACVTSLPRTNVILSLSAGTLLNPFQIPSTEMPPWTTQANSDTAPPGPRTAPVLTSHTHLTTLCGVHQLTDLSLHLDWGLLKDGELVPLISVSLSHSRDSVNAFEMMEQMYLIEISDLLAPLTSLITSS